MACTVVSATSRVYPIKPGYVVPPNIYNYPTSNADIVIDNTTFGTPLVAGDIVLIDLRVGGYGIIALNGLNSGQNSLDTTRMINIVFINGAYLYARSDNTGVNLATSLHGVNIVGAIVLARPEAMLRFTGNATRYPQYISFKDISTHSGRGIFTLDPTGGANYAGDTSNMYAWWHIQRCHYDSTWLNDGDNQAIQFFAPFSIGLNTFCRDIEIDHCTFNHYPAITQPSIFIQLALCFNVSIHDNTFSNLGMTATPVGHSSAVNYYLARVFGYNNHFGPNIIGDDFRGDNADLLGFSAYLGRGRIYNNVSENKIKYAHIEARWDGFDPSFNGLIEKRCGPEVYNITCFNMGTGARVGSFYAGSASILDWFDTDTVTLKNSVLVQLNPLDTVWNTTWVHSLDFALSPPYGMVDTASNKIFQFWANSGFLDSTIFVPGSGPVYGTGVAVPAYITTDIRGLPRTIAGRVDLGAIEQQGLGPYYYFSVPRNTKVKGFVP